MDESHQCGGFSVPAKMIAWRRFEGFQRTSFFFQNNFPSLKRRFRLTFAMSTEGRELTRKRAFSAELPLGDAHHLLLPAKATVIILAVSEGTGLMHTVSGRVYFYFILLFFLCCEFSIVLLETWVTCACGRNPVFDADRLT